MKYGLKSDVINNCGKTYCSKHISDSEFHIAFFLDVLKRCKI